MLGSEFGDARMKWTDFLKARRNGRIVLLYEPERLYRLIPKRVLSPEQIDDLEAVIDGAFRG